MRAASPPCVDATGSLPRRCSSAVRSSTAWMPGACRAGINAVVPLTRNGEPDSSSASRTAGLALNAAANITALQPFASRAVTSAPAPISARTTSGSRLQAAAIISAVLPPLPRSAVNLPASGSARTPAAVSAPAASLSARGAAVVEPSSSSRRSAAGCSRCACAPVAASIAATHANSNRRGNAGRGEVGGQRFDRYLRQP